MSIVKSTIERLLKIAVNTSLSQINLVGKISIKTSQSQDTEEREIADHLAKSIDVIRKISKSTLSDLEGAIKEIIVLRNYRMNVNYICQKKVLILRVPYFLDLNEMSDEEWSTGLTACLLVRVANLSKYSGRGDAVALASQKETEFAGKVGESWRKFYESEDKILLPFVFPFETNETNRVNQ